MNGNSALEYSLIERAKELSASKGKKARIIVTDNIENSLYRTIARDASDFAELLSSDITDVKKSLADFKGFKDDPQTNPNRKSRIERVDQILETMLQAFGVKEDEILPFISGALHLKSKKGDALLGGIDSSTEAF